MTGQQEELPIDPVASDGKQDAGDDLLEFDADHEPEEVEANDEADELEFDDDEA